MAGTLKVSAPAVGMSEKPMDIKKKLLLGKMHVKCTVILGRENKDVEKRKHPNHHATNAFIFFLIKNMVTKTVGRINLWL